MSYTLRTCNSPFDYLNEGPRSLRCDYKPTGFEGRKKGGARGVSRYVVQKEVGDRGVSAELEGSGQGSEWPRPDEKKRSQATLSTMPLPHSVRLPPGLWVLR